MISKVFRLKILFSVRNWWSCIYQELKDIFKENKQSFEGKSRTLTQFITFKNIRVWPTVSADQRPSSGCQEKVFSSSTVNGFCCWLL